MGTILINRKLNNPKPTDLQVGTEESDVGVLDHLAWEYGDFFVLWFSKMFEINR